MDMSSPDIESLERATLQAVPPEHLEELPGWLLPMDTGTVGRARSAVPLQHVDADPGDIDRVVARYRRQGFQPAFRLPDLPVLGASYQRLEALGFVRQQPTLVMTGTVDAMLSSPVAFGGCDLDPRPSEAWMAMYLGAGLDPVDGASRSRIMARAHDLRYASIGSGGQMLACGAASLGYGWLGVHGMRTAATCRRQGLASRVLHGMAQLARQQGLQRVFLQVDQSSSGACALYAKFGLRSAWTYAYWRPPGD
jgi:N-acetylglutamate synthase